MIAALQACFGQFKPGSYVDVSGAGACVVASEYRPATEDYRVSCGARDQFAHRSQLRARTPTAEDLRVTAEIKAALARLPRRGGGIGARYATREPRACKSRKDPLTAESARAYFICDAETEGATSLVLVTKVKIEIAPARSFNPTTDAAHQGIDPKQPVVDIRGSFTHYDCRQASPGDNAFARTHNCSAFDEPAAHGICYRNTFGDWRCRMHDLQADILGARQHVLPPESN
ncbi:MAG: hypothetical protein LAO79_20080 [Acidobacteriia bacterium]|nr:hypothetical protein [Terriglobia bacterium]